MQEAPKRAASPDRLDDFTVEADLAGPRIWVVQARGWFMFPFVNMFAQRLPDRLDYSTIEADLAGHRIWVVQALRAADTLVHIWCTYLAGPLLATWS